MISEEYYLQLRPGGSILTVHCSQYDEVNNMYTFYLLYGNSRFNDNGYTAKVSGTKPDKKGFEYAATFHYYSGSGSGDPSYAYVTINLKQQMTCVPGPVRCKLELSKTGGDFFTAPFILMVDAAGLADDVDISETVLPDYIDAAQRAAQEAASYVDSSEAWARGTRNGTPVSQSDETYHNNSKYYSEQSAAQVSLAAEQVTLAAAQVTLAQAQATAAAGSATTADTNAKNAEAWAVGKRGGTDVPSSDQTYHNNSKYYSEQASDSAAAAAASVAQGTQVEFWVQGGILYIQQTIQGVQQPAVALGSVTSPNTDYTFATIAEMNTAIGNDEVIPGAMCYVAESGGFIFRNESGTAKLYASLQTIGTRTANSTVGNNSLAIGIEVVASGADSCAQGNYCTASGTNSHAEGYLTEATGIGAHAEGSGIYGTTSYKTTASGQGAHAEGGGSVASGVRSHAEGYKTTASGMYSHAEGSESVAAGNLAHAEGYSTAYQRCHSEGYLSVAGDSSVNRSSNICHAEGYKTTATGDYGAHAEGNETTASGYKSHAEGGNTEASGEGSHAEGVSTTASGVASHAEGSSTTANAVNAHAEGQGTLASAACQHAGGSYNVEKTEAGNYMVIGNGTSSTRSNCFRVYTTAVYGNGAYNSSGADYAEYFEWLDANSNREDRAGRFVTLDGDKIRLANADDDFILGIVSGNASVIGDSHDDQWARMYERDVFGRYIFEDVEIPAETEEIDGETIEIIPAHMEHRLKLNPEYDGTQAYMPRSERAEWDAVGMVGKLVALDDGTCAVNEYCTPSDEGIATAAEGRTRYRVMKRLDENHIQVVIV